MKTTKSIFDAEEMVEKTEKEMFNELPNDVQEQVMNNVVFYGTTSVYFENGNYKASSHTMVSNHYAPDHRFVAHFSATELLTEEEHLIKEILIFGYSPTYNVNFYPNKACWNDKALKYETYRKQFIQNEIDAYVKDFNEYPSQAWIDMK